MQHLLRYTLRAGVALLLAALACAAGSAGHVAAAPRAAPATASLTGLNCSTACDLYATTGSIALPNLSGTVPIWTYTSAAGPATTLGGPVIIANAGETLNITLHNNLTVATSLSIIGVVTPADMTGIAPGGTKVYAIRVPDPGTYVYEAGVMTGGERQVAMGMYGTLIVRPTSAPGTAYSAATAFDDEALLVFSEIDPAFNAAPTTYNIGTLTPKYWLINGQPYNPSNPISPISVNAGKTTLLRLVNAGVTYHSVGLLGLNETVIAVGAKPLSLSYSAVAETISAGDTLDALLSIPATDADGTLYPIYDAGLHIDNNGSSFGGMLTFLKVTSSATTTDTAGPVTSGVAVTPGNPNGTGAAALSATVNDNSTGGSSIAAAEYFIDTVGANGGGTALTGAFGAPTVNVNATIAAATVNVLSSGTHTIYVHGQDSLGNWGPVSNAHLVIDTAGPTTNVVLTPSVINAGTLTVRANGDDTTTSGSNVTTAEYIIQAASATAPTGNGVGTDMGAASQAGPTASFSVANITAPATEGAYNVYTHTRDALGNWGAWTSATLTVDKLGPTGDTATVSPNPNNGTLSANGGPGTQGGNFPSILVTAHFADPISNGVNSTVVAGEVFIDTVGANGSGALMQPTNGTFSTASENAYVYIPLGQIVNLAVGPHTIFIHGKDAAGNWGATTSATLIIDKAAPTVSGMTITPNPGVTVVALAATVTDPANGAAPASAIAAAEYYIDTDPGVGLATPITTGLGPSPAHISASINLNALTAGNHTVGVRAKDAAGNWSARVTAPFTVDRLFANSFALAGAPYGWSGTGGTAARLSLSNTAGNIVDAGTRSLAASITGGNSGHVINNLPPAAPNNANVTSYHARFYVNPNGANINPTNAATPPTPTIFAAMSATNRSTTVFQVQLRRNGTQYQVRATNANASAVTAWINITGATAIEVARAGTTLTLYVGGVSQGTVTVANTNLTAARLGLSAGIPTGTNLGTIFFDGFVSTRNLLIGP